MVRGKVMKQVLILIVMEYLLREIAISNQFTNLALVLILIVMEYLLRDPIETYVKAKALQS